MSKIGRESFRLGDESYSMTHTPSSDASEKKEENSVSTFGRFRLWTSFESSPVSVKGDFVSKANCLYSLM